MSRSSKFEVIAPTDDPGLLTLEELRSLIGAGPSNEDLIALGDEAAEWVASICGVRTGNGHPPTFRLEWLRETFQPPASYDSALVLGRRFIVAVRVIENDMELALGTDYILQDVQGIVDRRAGGFPVAWWGAPVVVDYLAGFGPAPPYPQTQIDPPEWAGGPPGGSPEGSPPLFTAAPIPALLKASARDYCRLRHSASQADPLVRSETVEDIDSITYADAASTAEAFSALETMVASRLSRFITGTPG